MSEGGPDTPAESEAAAPAADQLRRSRGIQLPSPGAKRAVVIGGGSFGTAVAVLLARGGLRTTLQTRTEEQARSLRETRENRAYLDAVELPRELRIEPISAGLSRADYVFLSVPSPGLRQVIEGLEGMGLSRHAAVITMAKGLVPPDGSPPTALLAGLFGSSRIGCVGGPAHAREMVSAGAGLVAASVSEALATEVAGVFLRAGVVCEESGDPVGGRARRGRQERGGARFRRHRWARTQCRGRRGGAHLFRGVAVGAGAGRDRSR